MAKIYVIIDGLRHEVKKDVKLVFENVYPVGSGPCETDIRLWAFQEKTSPTGEHIPAHVMLDWIEEDQICMTEEMSAEDFAESLF